MNLCLSSSPEMTRSTEKRINHLATKFAEHAQRHPLSPVAPASKTTSQPEIAKTKYATSWLNQFQLLSKRSFRLMMREKANNIAMFSQTVVFALLLGLIWLQQGKSLDEAGSVPALAGA